MGDLVSFSASERLAHKDARSDHALVVAALAGDSQAKESLYRRHASMVVGMTYRLLGGDRDVDDIVQDVFVKAYSCLEQLDDPQAFAAWVGSITVRRVREHLRRKRLRRIFGFERSEPADLDGLVSTAASPEVVAELNALYKLLEELPTEVRIALVLRRVEALTVPEIALQMNLSRATVKRRIAFGDALLAQKAPITDSLGNG